MFSSSRTLNFLGQRLLSLVNFEEIISIYKRNFSPNIINVCERLLHLWRRPCASVGCAFARVWWLALPLSSVGNKMDNATVRIAAGSRLGAPIVRSHVCVCGKTVTVDGHHGLFCRFGSSRHSRHNRINDVLCRAFIKSGTLATCAPHSLCTGSGKRPDGVTQVPWSRGRCLAWDATWPDTFAVSHVLASSTRAGSAAATAEAIWNRRSTLTSQLASISSLLRSRHREPRVSRPFTSSWKSAAD